LPCHFPPPLFGLQENVVGIAELLFPPLPDLAEAVPVMPFEIVAVSPATPGSAARLRQRIGLSGGEDDKYGAFW